MPSRDKGKICLVTPDILGPIRNGGIGTACANLAALLSAAGFEVWILYTLGGHCETGTIEEWIGFYRAREIRLVPLPRLERITNLAVWPKRSYEAYCWLRDREFDLIHFPDWNGSGYFSVLAKHQGLAFPKAKLVLGLHGPSEWVWERNREPLRSVEQLEIDFLEKQSFALADLVVSPSAHVLDLVRERNWPLPKESQVLPHPLPEGAGIPPETDFRKQPIEELVFFGRLESLKGIELFCDAIDLLVQRRPKNVSVTFLGKPALVGGRIPAVEYLAGRTRHWPVGPRILPDMDRDEALRYLREGKRLAVIASPKGGYGFTVLECLSVGIPFVAADTGRIPDVVHPEDRERVLFFPDPEGCARKLEGVLREGMVPARPADDPGELRARWIRAHEEWVGEERERKNSPPSGFRPFVSVILVHYNRPAFLGQAINSLLSQDYGHYEVILVDDGSDLPEAKAKIEVLGPLFAGKSWKILVQDNGGSGAARNRGARLASGEYLLFMDDDNVAKPEEISTFVRVAEETGADIFTCWADRFRGEEAPGKGTIPAEIAFFLGAAPEVGLFYNCFGDTNALVKKSVFERLGGFDEDRELPDEDHELFLRAVLEGVRLEAVPLPLFWYRVGPGRQSAPKAPGSRCRVFASYWNTLPGNAAKAAALMHRRWLEAGRTERELRDAMARLEERAKEAEGDRDRARIELRQTQQKLREAQDELARIGRSRAWRWGTRLRRWERAVRKRRKAWLGMAREKT